MVRQLTKDVSPVLQKKGESANTETLFVTQLKAVLFFFEIFRSFRARKFEVSILCEKVFWRVRTGARGSEGFCRTLYGTDTVCMYTMYIYTKYVPRLRPTVFLGLNKLLLF